MDPNWFTSKFVTSGQFLERKKAQKPRKQTVFTNGCFDLLHPGHVDLLWRARFLGDELVVGLNSDDSVKRLKGRHRPVNTARDRAFVLCALECTDFVIPFGEDNPLQLIEIIRPDVLVKGGDWPVEGIVGRERVEGWGGSVHSLHMLPGYSTSKLIERIRRLPEL